MPGNVGNVVDVSHYCLDVSTSFIVALKYLLMIKEDQMLCIDLLKNNIGFKNSCLSKKSNCLSIVMGFNYGLNAYYLVIGVYSGGSPVNARYSVYSLLETSLNKTYHSST